MARDEWDEDDDGGYDQRWDEDPRAWDQPDPVSYRTADSRRPSRPDDRRYLEPARTSRSDRVVAYFEDPYRSQEYQIDPFVDYDDAEAAAQTPQNAKFWQRPGRPRRRSLFWRARRIVFVFLLLSLVLAAVTWRVLTKIEIPKENATKTASLVCDASVEKGKCSRSNSVAQFASDVSRVELSYAEIPQVMKDAAISAEDRTYFQHKGINLLAIASALYDDLKSNGNLRGASTITQQYVKMKYLENTRSVKRKVFEQMMAIKIERLKTKEQILEEYLNLIPLGRGAYGVESGSYAWFGHGAKELTPAEASYLAARIRGPNEDDPEILETRRQGVLGFMELDGLLDAKAAKQARENPPTIVEKRAYTNLGTVPADLKASGYEYLMEMARLEAYERFGSEKVLSGGLRIYTTVNPAFQKVAYTSIYQTLNDPAAHPDGALVSLDESGAIRALVGGRDFSNGELNLAISGEGGNGRPTGSTMKAIVLAAYVQANYSLKSTYDSPGRIVLPEVGTNGGDWEVDNFMVNDKPEDEGIVDVKKATALSLNTVYAQIMQKVTPEKVVEMAAQLGIEGLKPQYSLVLGPQNVSPETMAAAYLVFANHGMYRKPYLIWRVEDSSGKVLFDINAQPDFQPRQVLPAEVADTVANALSAVPTDEGTAPNAALPNTRVAGKTGTSQDNFDAWFVGFTCNKFATAVWMGYPEGNRSMVNLKTPVTTYKQITGGTLPAIFFRQYMEATVDTDPSCRFPETDAGKTVDKGPVLTRPTTTTTTIPGATTVPGSSGTGGTADITPADTGTTTGTTVPTTSSN